MELFSSVIIPFFFGLAAWLAQKEHEVFLSIASSVIFIINEAKKCYTPFGSNDDEKDLNLREGLFYENVKRYTEELQRALISLSLLKNTDSMQIKLDQYLAWEREFQVQILMCSFGQDNVKIDAKQREYFWDGDNKKRNLLDKLAKELREEFEPHLNSPYFSWFQRHILEIFKVNLRGIHPKN